MLETVWRETTFALLRCILDNNKKQKKKKKKKNKPEKLPSLPKFKDIFGHVDSQMRLFVGNHS